MILELHLTYRCDLACHYCNRGCRINTTHTPDMTIGQFERLVASLPEKPTKIVLIGGEPTLHPNIKAFAERALAVAGLVQIYSNGTSEVSRKVLAALEKMGVNIFCGTYKESSVVHGMQTMFISPLDLGIARTTPCSWAAVAGTCGYSVDSKGITPCSCGGAIDGILNLGIRSWDWDYVRDPKTLQCLCKRCGTNFNFKDDQLDNQVVKFRGQTMTRSWAMAAVYSVPTAKKS